MAATQTKFTGRHYETGTIVNALTALGNPLPESTVLGASGGIAFGYFTFEYEGHLPWVSILTRNTFHPMDRAFDNLGIRREVFETLKPDRAEENLRRELDFGNPVLAWADMFSMPHLDFACESYGSRPFLVVGHDEKDFYIVDGGPEPFPIPAETFSAARSRIGKDRNRIMTLAKPNEEVLNDGIRSALATCAALYLDKPPAGSTKNFGITGMAQWSKMLRETRNAGSWARKFDTGPKLVMALAGTWMQPGVWDWIETWGTDGSADRAIFADFLDLAADRLKKPGLGEAAEHFRFAAPLWSQLAECALCDDVKPLVELKEIKKERRAMKRSGNFATSGLKARYAEIARNAEGQLMPHSERIRNTMADLIDQIATIESEAALALRRS